MPQMFHQRPHKPEDDCKCCRPSLKFFVDDALTLVTREPQHNNMKEAITQAMEDLTEYMDNNKLILNPDKSQIMLWTKDDNERRHFQIELEGKIVKHQKEVTILGNLISEKLTWESQIKKNVIPSLRNRVRTFRAVSKYMEAGFKARFANAIFRSKLMFGLKSWGGGPKTLINTIQTLQDQMTKLTIPKKYAEKHPRQRQKILKWLDIRNEIDRATHLQTFKFINTDSLGELQTLMPLNNKARRIAEHRKLSTKPKWLMKSKLTRSLYRSRAYTYNNLPKSITQITELNKFKKRTKKTLDTEITP